MTDITRIELLDIIHDLTGKNPNKKKDAPKDDKGEEEEQEWNGPHIWRWNDQDWTATERRTWMFHEWVKHDAQFRETRGDS